jgi:hypothetical protein
MNGPVLQNASIQKDKIINNPIVDNSWLALNVTDNFSGL